MTMTVAKEREREREREGEREREREREREMQAHTGVLGEEEMVVVEECEEVDVSGEGEEG